MAAGKLPLIMFARADDGGTSADADGGPGAAPPPSAMAIATRGVAAAAADTGGIDTDAPARGSPPRDTDAVAEYHARRPEPNYRQFRAEMVDQYGRQYGVARSGSFLERQNGLANDTFTTPPPGDGPPRKLGRLLLFLRMPINQRHSVPLPAPDGEKLELYYVDNQVVCTATTDGVFVASRARTGYVFVDNFVSRGRATDPSLYEPWLRDTAREPGAQWF